MKKKLTRQEEFELMKLIMDKFLWVGIIIALYGLYRVINSVGSFGYNMIIIVIGSLIMALFTILLVREFEYAK